ncbi:MAG: energy transducer TonB, partial [Acidobacteriota bacterium]|nr:energy transducer TonB [Acidobacteriota bacterium]
TIKGDSNADSFDSSRPRPTKQDLEGATRGFGESETAAPPREEPPRAEPPPPPPPPPPAVPKRISKGVVNGQAISLPVPAYPAAARAVNAKGSVSVAIVISKSGSVMSASAVSGHPLLRQAAASAARRAKFRPTLLSGQPVEVSGVIVYNFN